eukprot:6105595-Pyramimonas_sp.AAC.1
MLHQFPILLDPKVTDLVGAVDRKPPDVGTQEAKPLGGSHTSHLVSATSALLYSWGQTLLRVLNSAASK